VGVDTSLALIDSLKRRVREERLTEPDQLTEALKEEMVAILERDGTSGAKSGEPVDQEAKPLVVLIVGVNGVGKTTSIAKLAHHFQGAGKRVLLGAADTFRAAAIEQLQVLGQRVGADIIAHQQGSDPGAVAFDAYHAAKARNADVLIIDTAGRLHTKSNLMEELKKVHRVLNRLDTSSPHQVILVLDATTGHNGLSQARYFTEAVSCTGVFLAKLDGTARGGIVLAVSKELNLPILFIGAGEKLEDMALFDAREFVDALLAPTP